MCRYIDVTKLGDKQVHTDTHPFCANPLCECHENQELIAIVAVYVADGLLMESEATRLIEGKAI
jgi:hypothetical protein